MICRDLTRLVESQDIHLLAEEELREYAAHASACRRCAPVWIAHVRLAAVGVPPMPVELAARCSALAAAHRPGSVLRFAPRGLVIALGGCVVLAAAAGALSVHLVHRGAGQDPAATAGMTAQPGPAINHVEEGESDMNKQASIAAVAVALGAAAAQAQDAAALPEPQRKSAEEIIATNDLNGDGIVTREEAARVNGNLFVMWNDVYDTDHDGRVDVAEVRRAMNAVQVGSTLDKITGESGGHMAGARSEAILANNDLDKDGVVTKEEARKSGKALIRMWDSYDLNKDGKVELAELAKVQGY